MAFLAAAMLVAALSVSAQQTVLLPGVADLPVLYGSVYSPDCGGLRELVGADMQCVGAPAEEIDGLMNAYAAEARRHGWKDGDGAANALWLTRATPQGCEKLTIAGFWDFRADTDYREGLPALVGFLVEPVGRCE